DRLALEAAASRLDDKDEAIRVAAIGALAKLGNASLIERLAKLAATAGGAPQQAARLSLVRLAGADIEPKLFTLAAAGEPAERIEIIRALASRRSNPAAPVLLKAATDDNALVRAAAFDALAVVAQADRYGQLVQLLVAATTPADAEAAEQAVLATGGRIEDPAARLGPLTAALSNAAVQVKPSCLRVLSGFGGVEALAAVRPYLAESEAALRDAAVRAVARWPDVSAAGDLLKIAQSSDNATQRLLSVRGYLRLVGTVKEEDARLKMLEQVRPIATTAASKRLLLGVLTEAADSGALHVASSFLDDTDVPAEAAAATLKIANALVRTNAPAVRAAMKKLMDTTQDQALADQAAALDEEALKAPSPGAGQAALQYDKQRSDSQKAALAKRPPPGYHLVGYLDCGPDTADGVKGGPLLRHVSGATYFWAESDRVADARFGSVFFDSTKVTFEASGLSPKKSYQIGFTWWDYDHGTRAQSVWAATGKGERETKLLDKTPLPSVVNKQGPDGKTLPVPTDLVADGSLRITFRNEATPNVVVSEVWLWESDVEVPAKPTSAVLQSSEASPTSAVSQTSEVAVRPNVLLITGQELHDWKKTTPALVELLQQDPRLHVRVVEDPGFLADSSIHQYDAIVLHFMNWQVPAPGPEARQNFQKFVEGGKGVCLVHFACGAWQDWPEFRHVVGRAWDPKLRAHDPRGPFRVTFTEVKHPLSAGLQAFDADDELYTCLAGDRPIEVLAVARSKVDSQDYPMAFVLPSGKGRVFQCLLGHDVKALQMPGVGELYRRGCAWAAGLPPK
ncbi:MAG: ThuA domain-containing protein, partial [Planctomycetota bacterium]|nr:ThuA domain-containing protein [Planctomycetota bacterium]